MLVVISVQPPCTYKARWRICSRERSIRRGDLNPVCPARDEESRGEDSFTPRIIAEEAPRQRDRRKFDEGANSTSRCAYKRGPRAEGALNQPRIAAAERSRKCINAKDRLANRSSPSFFTRRKPAKMIRAQESRMDSRDEFYPCITELRRRA